MKKELLKQSDLQVFKRLATLEIYNDDANNKNDYLYIVEWRGVFNLMNKKEIALSHYPDCRNISWRSCKGLSSDDAIDLMITAIEDNGEVGIYEVNDFINKLLTKKITAKDCDFLFDDEYNLLFKDCDDDEGDY